MTDEELEARLQFIRHKRDVVRPAAKKHVERAEKKGSQGRVTKAADLFGGLSEADKQQLLQLLGE